jgi:hypothetical protein
VGIAEFLDLRGEVEVVERGNFGDDAAHDDGEFAAAVKDVGAEARPAVGEDVGAVDGAVMVEEVLAFLVGDDEIDEFGHLGVAARGAVEKAGAPIDADHRDGAGLEMEVGAADFDDGFGEVVKAEAAFLDLDLGLGRVGKLGSRVVGHNPIIFAMKSRGDLKFAVGRNWRSFSMRVRMEAWDKTRRAAACGGHRAGTSGGGTREAGCLGEKYSGGPGICVAPVELGRPSVVETRMNRKYAERRRIFGGIFCLVSLLILGASRWARGDETNLVQNPAFEERTPRSGSFPADYRLSGHVEYRYLGDPRRDISGWGVALQSGGNGDRSGSVSQLVTGIDSKAGRWFRFSFRGLPQDDFVVDDNDLTMRVEFFADGGRTAMDAKGKPLYPIIELARRNMTANGDRHVGGAAVWQTYSMDFWLPFPQVDTVRLSVVFGHGAAPRALASEFFVTDFSLTRITGDLPAPADGAAAGAPARQPRGTPVALGGRWFYDASADAPRPPAVFDSSNADRLLYQDGEWETPFLGEMSAWLKAGDKDLQGNVVSADQFVPDNVTVRFDGTSMIVHTHGLPNQPTGRFPELGFGNPNYIQEQDSTYYFPLNPTVNPRHVATATDNSNHALPMGPIGVAVNGVVFFNPFDANSQDASSLMDRCCGHPSPDNVYHYHKYPICLNSPWADEGKEHSPIIGLAFDGFAIYGPYASAGLMAKDVTGAYALNEFNVHSDKDRGWHYQVTPGKFPYIIGGYWGYADERDINRGHPGGGGMGPPGGGMGGPEGGGGGPDQMGPPPERNGMGPPPDGAPFGPPDVGPPPPPP